MVKFFQILLLIVIPLGCVSQNKLHDAHLTLIGKYTTDNISHNSRAHYEELNLMDDSTFSYQARIGHFVHIKKNGKWTVLEGSIVLSENSAKSEKIVVNEKFNSDVPSGFVKFNVRYFNGASFNYAITAMSGDTTLTLKNQFSSSSLKLSSVDSFLTESGLMTYPLYVVKSKRSNEFDISVNAERVFFNEQWKIEKDGVIRPLYLDNKPACYVLTRTER